MYCVKRYTPVTHNHSGDYVRFLAHKGMAMQITFELADFRV
jgi:hypothetical protein